MEDIFLNEGDMEEDTQKGKYMVFKTDDEFYGLELKCVNEIIGIQPITEIPEVEDYIRGLINLRGKIIPVIDVRIRFRQEPHEYTDRTCIIVVDVKEFTVGLIVEKIVDVVSISDDNIEPPPSISTSNGKNKYVFALGKSKENVILLLDPEKLLGTGDYALMEELMTQEENE